MPQAVLTTRALKCTVLLDPAEIQSLVMVDGQPRVSLHVRTADGRTVTADIAAKAAQIEKHVHSAGPIGDGETAILTRAGRTAHGPDIRPYTLQDRGTKNSSKRATA